MEIISKNNEKFNAFEEKIYKELMNKGIKRIQEWFRKVDEILLKSRDKQLLKPKDFKKTTVKCRFGYVEYYRKRYEITINGKKRYVYLLDQDNFIKYYKIVIFDEITLHPNRYLTFGVLFLIL